MTEPSERIVLQAYRAASEVLDEAPAQDARAAILAAAARASGARPRPIGRPPRWRVPLAAAASVLVGTIAVLLATQVERQRGAEQAETVAAASPAASPAVVAGAAGEATPSAAPPPTAAAPGVPAAPKSAATAPPRRERETTKPAAAPMQEARVGETAAGGRAAEAGPAGAADSAAPAPAAPAPPVAAAERAEPAPPQAQVDAAPSAGASAQAPARSAARLASEARADAAAPWRAAPESWVEKIVKLRAEGRHDEADKELAALRARHPDLRLPPAALPAGGR